MHVCLCVSVCSYMCACVYFNTNTAQAEGRKALTFRAWGFASETARAILLFPQPLCPKTTKSSCRRACHGGRPACQAFCATPPRSGPCQSPGTTALIRSTSIQLAADLSPASPPPLSSSHSASPLSRPRFVICILGLLLPEPPRLLHAPLLLLLLTLSVQAVMMLKLARICDRTS